MIPHKSIMARVSDNNAKMLLRLLCAAESRAIFTCQQRLDANMAGGSRGNFTGRIPTISWGERLYLGRP